MWGRGGRKTAIIQRVLIIGRFVVGIAVVPLRRSPPSCSKDISRLLFSAGVPRDRRMTGGERGERTVEGCDRRCYADRAYLELADASQSIYLAKVPLDRCSRTAATPAISILQHGGRV